MPQDEPIDHTPGDPTIYTYGTRIRMKKKDGSFCILECTPQGWKLVETEVTNGVSV